MGQNEDRSVDVITMATPTKNIKLLIYGQNLYQTDLSVVKHAVALQQSIFTSPFGHDMQAGNRQDGCLLLENFEVLREISMTRSIEACKMHKHSNSLHNVQICNNINYSNANR